MMFFFGRGCSKTCGERASASASVVLAFALGVPGGLAIHATTRRASAVQPFEKILYTWLGTGTAAFAFRDRRSDAMHRSMPMPAFLLDPLSSIWLLFVTGVGMLIHIYSHRVTWRTKAGTTASSAT